MFAGELIGPMIAFGLEATRLTDRVPGASSIRARWKRSLERSRAVARPPYLTEAAAALGGGVLLVIVGATGRRGRATRFGPWGRR
jgi:hypothetical protein